MIERIEKCCLNHWDEQFFVSSAGSLTFGELWNGATRLASALSGGSSPVIVRGHKEPYMPITFLACLLVGRAYVPCDTFLPEKRLKYIQNASGADVVIDRLPDLPDKPLSKFSAHPQDTAYIIFTSGSTGTPKGVRITHKNIDCFVNWLATLEPMGGMSASRVLSHASFSFDLSVCELYYSMCFGHTCCCLESGGGDSFADITLQAASFDPAVAVMTPTFASLALCDPDFGQKMLPSLSCIFFCGEVLSAKVCAKLFVRFPGITLLNAYGPTECTCAVSAVKINEEMLAGESLPVGQVGKTSVEVIIENDEIVLCGDAVSPGYIDGEGNGFEGDKYYTGDLGKISDDGYIFCLGRRDSRIKLNGYRIDTEEIRRCLCSLDGVSICTVFAEKGRDGSVRHIRAIAAGDNLNKDNLRRQLAECLPAYMVPKIIETVSKLKLTPNGKNAL